MNAQTELFQLQNILKALETTFNKFKGMHKHKEYNWIEVEQARFKVDCATKEYTVVIEHLGEGEYYKNQYRIDFYTTTKTKEHFKQHLYIHEETDFRFWDKDKTVWLGILYNCLFYFN